MLGTGAGTNRSSLNESQVFQSDALLAEMLPNDMIQSFKFLYRPGVLMAGRPRLLPGIDLHEIFRLLFF